MKSLRRVLGNNIEMEAEMVEFTRKLALEADDPRLKLIFSAIHADELKHHKLLLDIEKQIAERETFTEEELWDAIWKDSPWHGSPGG